MKYILINIYIYIYIYIKNKKKILEISVFLFKAYIDLKNWLIVPKCQLSARQSFSILKVSSVRDNCFLILNFSKFV